MPQLCWTKWILAMFLQGLTNQPHPQLLVYKQYRPSRWRVGGRLPSSCPRAPEVLRLLRASRALHYWRIIQKVTFLQYNKAESNHQRT